MGDPLRAFVERQNIAHSLHHATICNWNHQDMSRNIYYLVVGALVVAAGVFGYIQKTPGIEINVGKSGILSRRSSSTILG